MKSEENEETGGNGSGTGRTTRVELRLESGPGAKDYKEIAKREHLEPLQVELRQIADELGAYQKNLLLLKRREESMRSLHDGTAFG